MRAALIHKEDFVRIHVEGDLHYNHENNSIVFQGDTIVVKHLSGNGKMDTANISENIEVVFSSRYLNGNNLITMTWKDQAVFVSNRVISKTLTRQKLKIGENEVPHCFISQMEFSLPSNENWMLIEAKEGGIGAKPASGYSEMLKETLLYHEVGKDALNSIIW